jgi:Tfp pilus assembly protein PilO
MIKELSSRTQADGRINLGTKKSKLMIGLLHWAKDFGRVSEKPTISGLNQDDFMNQLEIAIERADYRSRASEQLSTRAKESDPGPLKSEKEWKDWEQKFSNYAGCHFGSAGVPLSYVIRKNDDPDPSAKGLKFVARTIASAPLSGTAFEHDSLQVHEMLVNFTTGQPSHAWIKSVERFEDGRRSMKALREHFEGKGNATRNLAEANRLRETLHYKNERSLSFEKFLSMMQEMFNIYSKEDQELSEKTKIDLLFSKVQHQGLQAAIEALRTKEVEGIELTYTAAANHLATTVARLTAVTGGRNVSAVGVSGNSGSGIYNADGSIKTGHISNWRSLSEEERSKVYEERKRLGVGKKKGGDKGGSGTDQQAANTLKQLRQQNKKQRRKIKALMRKSPDGEGSDSDDLEVHDAGDQFGGKNAKKKSKSN